MIAWIIPLAVLSGILGRMGGAHGYDTKWRDIGCSLIAMACVIIVLGFNIKFWWVYALVFGLHWASFTTYWDWLFKGVDNLWFSGFMVGLAMLPVIFVVPWKLWMILLRAVLLAIAWGLLNRYLPQRIIIWRRDVVEEFLRYAIIV